MNGEIVTRQNNNLSQHTSGELSAQLALINRDMFDAFRLGAGATLLLRKDEVSPENQIFVIDSTSAKHASALGEFELKEALRLERERLRAFDRDIVNLADLISNNPTKVTEYLGALVDAFRKQNTAIRRIEILLEEEDKRIAQESRMKRIRGEDESS